MNFRGDDRARRNAGPDRPRGERDDHRDSNDRPVQREGGPNGDQRGQDSPHRNEEERAERQRRERQRFEQAAASAMAKQRRDDSIDQAVAEITARQQALDGDIATEITAPPRPREGEAAPAPPFGERPSAPPGPPPAPEPDRVFAAWPGGWRSQNSPEAPVDISGLEEQLRQMTARIEALRPSSELETAIAGLRTELAEIGRSFTEALPRRALESIEIEVKALGQRLDHSRQAGVDAAALAGIERGLAEVHEALSGLTPAEGLVGFDEAVKALGKKIDAIVSKDDAGALQQLEAAIGSLRGIVSHVASNDALNKVAEDVRALSAKVDGLASIGPNTPTLVALENRIDILASALNASTEAGHAVPRELEKLLSSLIEKLERAQLTNADHAALAHLEDRIAALVKRLDASDARFGLLEGVERGLADLLVYIDQLRDDAVVGPKTPAAAGAIEHEFAEVKQSERRPAKASEAAVEDIQGPVGPVVDRLAAIESDTWTDRPKAVSAAPMPSPMPAPALPPLPAYESETEAMAADAVISEPTPRLSLSESTPQRPAAHAKADRSEPAAGSSAGTGLRGSLAQSAVRCRTHRRVRSRCRIEASGYSGSGRRQTGFHRCGPPRRAGCRRCIARGQEASPIQRGRSRSAEKIHRARAHARRRCRRRRHRRRRLPYYFAAVRGRRLQRAGACANGAAARTIDAAGADRAAAHTISAAASAAGTAGSKRAASR